MLNTILILGSAVDGLRARKFDVSKLSAIVAINNAWRIREDWTHLVHAGDFPSEQLPEPAINKKIISHQTYVPANNRYGGIIYAGGTMAFSTAYWALNALKPDMLAFCGCDMIYQNSGGKTHFYGKGEADPLRADPTLQSLEAKSNRLLLLGANNNCLCVNLSEQKNSRLTFPRLAPTMLGQPLADFYQRTLAGIEDACNVTLVNDAIASEAKLNCFVKSGDYWNFPEKINKEGLFEIDRLWLESLKPNDAAISAHQI